MIPFAFHSIVMTAALTHGVILAQVDEAGRRGRLVFKNDKVLIHAFAGASPKKGELIFDTSRPDASFVTHTSLATGEMKVLAASAKFVTRIPMGIDQYLGQQTYVAGVVADAERVYVLLVTDAYFGGGPLYASLHVFRTDTGALLHAEAKVGKDLWKKNHPPTAGPGPLQLRKNGVELDGELYEFKGTQLIKPMGKDKK